MQGNNSRNNLFNRKRRRVNVMSVFCCTKWRCLTLRISLIASFDVFEDLLLTLSVYLSIVSGGCVSTLALNGATVSTCCRISGQENLYICLGEYHGANVTTFCDYIAILASTTLQGNHSLTYFRDGCNSTDVSVYLWGTNLCGNVCTVSEDSLTINRVSKRDANATCNLNDFLGISHINALT